MANHRQIAKFTYRGVATSVCDTTRLHEDNWIVVVHHISKGRHLVVFGTAKIEFTSKREAVRYAEYLLIIERGKRAGSKHLATFEQWKDACAR